METLWGHHSAPDIEALSLKASLRPCITPILQVEKLRLRKRDLQLMEYDGGNLSLFLVPFRIKINMKYFIHA